MRITLLTLLLVTLGHLTPALALDDNAFAGVRALPVQTMDDTMAMLQMVNLNQLDRTSNSPISRMLTEKAMLNEAVQQLEAAQHSQSGRLPTYSH